MKAIRWVVVGGAMVSVAVASVALFGSTESWPGKVEKDGSTRLANGKRIHPVGRVHIPLRGDLPLSMTASADSSKCLVVTGGYHDHGIAVVNLGDEVTDTFVPTTKCTGGLIVMPDGTGYLAAGDLGIRRIQVTSDKDNWSPTDFKFADHAWIQGLGKLPNGRIVATDMNNDSLLCLQPGQAQPVWTIKIGHKPSRIAVDGSHSVIAVTDWGGSSIDWVDFDGKNLHSVAVGAQPSELLFNQDGTLFVSNAGSNSVSVVRDGSVVATIFTSLTPKDLVGSTPTGLALTPDQKHLFVANSGSNNVQQIDVSDPIHPKSEGFIPTGWYPTTVFVPQDGKRLLIGTAKGLGAHPNFPGIKPEQTLSDDLRIHYDYLPNRLEGDVMVVDLPTRETLDSYTKICVRDAEREMPASLVEKETALLPTLRKIKHVLYVIRENRTYDQVLGDLMGANGEPNLCMYGEKVTPNGHKIARQFKTFDNLYCDGEVSQDGHQWCCSSYCTDYTEKVWPSGYADRGRADEDESVAGSPAGYLWDSCRFHGLSFRSYGEFASFRSNRGSAPQYQGISGLDGHASEKWSTNGGRDIDRVSVFIDEMKEAEQKGDWWNFMVMSLGEDHTSGRDPGEFTPFSKVASNDAGLGKLVEAISRSKFWADTAIFVIEDDAQDGPDHIDGHRTVGYVISPYIKRGGADHTMYSTASMVRTMELMLGLPPMTQTDRHATSMVASFTDRPDLTPFAHEEPRIDLAARNPKQGKLAMESSKLDFSAYDHADPVILNRILWEDAKPGVPYPVASHLSR
jgi:hypothetical protein